MVSLQGRQALLFLIVSIIILWIIVFILRVGLVYLFFRLAKLEKSKFREIIKGILIVTALQGFIDRLFMGKDAFVLNAPFSWIPLPILIQEGSFSIKYLHHTALDNIYDMFQKTGFAHQGLIISIPNQLLIYNITVNLISIIYFFYITKFVLHQKGKIQFLTWLILSLICYNFTFMSIMPK